MSDQQGSKAKHSLLNTMKIRLLISLLVFSTLLFVPVQSQAASMAIGYDVWFNWWEVSVGDWYFYSYKTEYLADPSFLYGPMISFNITPQWAISSLFIMGSYAFHFIGESDDDTIRLNYETWRYDSDTTVSYSFSKNFRMFFGFKYLRYTYELKNYLSSGDKLKTAMDDFAPGAGVLFIVPLTKNLYISFNTGVLFSFTQITTEYESAESSAFGSSSNRELGYYKFAANSKTSLSYDIEKIHMIIALRIRYQVFFYLYDVNEVIEFADRVDHLYGIDFSVTFYFDL